MMIHPKKNERFGYISFAIAKQVRIKGDECKFDWDNSMRFVMHQEELADFLCVLRGMSESMGDGKGVVVKDPFFGSRSIRFAHYIEPRAGYLIAVVNPDDPMRQSYDYFFTPKQAFSMALAFEQAMLYVMFGTDWMESK